MLDTINEKAGRQTAGGARASCGPRIVIRTAGANAGIGNRVPMPVCASTISVCGGPASACTLHCMPQPPAQGHPFWWLPGACELATEAPAEHRLKGNAPPATTDNGSSKACSAIK